MDFKLVSRTLLLAVAGVSFAIPALAQWQWLDKDGRKVYSDRSPPADILEKNILKRPPGSKVVVTPVANEDSPATPAAVGAAPKPNAGAAPKLSGKDAQLEAKKKQADDEEAVKKKADEEKVAKARTDNCERAKKAQTSLQTGGRMVAVNAKGEREIMDDNAKAAEAKRLQAIVDSDCK